MNATSRSGNNPKCPDMVLYGGPTSPFARMALVLGRELGIPFRYEVINIYTAEFIDRLNPLRQIPTLIVGGDTAYYDSRVIFACFDRLSGRPSMLPGDDDAQATRIALLLGLTEACLHYRMEIIRPDGARSDETIAKQSQRIERCLDHLEGIADRIVEGPLRLEQIVAGCALEYIDFRFSTAWRARCPVLSDWSATFSRRPAMVESRPDE